MTVLFDGSADFLYPDGTYAVVTVNAGQRGGRWTGNLRLPNGDRRLEKGDVCRLTHDRFDGELRVVITEQTGSARYSFIGLIKPDPWETL
jgi:hypothetical protein